MWQKFKAYWAKNTTDLIAWCNFISRILWKLIFISLGICILLIIIGAFIADDTIKAPAWIENIFAGLLYIFVLILVYSSKVFLIIIPLIWPLQCWYGIKGRKAGFWVFGNPILWFFIAMLTAYSYYDDKRYEECMSWCVLPDESNIEECVFNTCDFVF